MKNEKEIVGISAPKTRNLPRSSQKRGTDLIIKKNNIPQKTIA